MRNQSANYRLKGTEEMILSKMNSALNLYRFCKYKSTYKKGGSTSYSVQSIITNHQRNPNFVYKQTKDVCNTIKSLFQKMPERPQHNINELKRLTKAVHLSNFASWKALKETTSIINSVLNQNFNSNKNSLDRGNLLSLCQVLHQLNYELDSESDNNFINTQLLSSFKSDDIKLTSQQSMKLLQVFSKHPLLFKKLTAEKLNLQTVLQKRINQTQKIFSKFEENIISSLVKNGIYQSFWDDKFLQSLIQILQSKQNKSESGYESLLNTLKLNGVGLDPIQKDEWKIKILQNEDESSNFVTQNKIFNILKELDYNVETNHRLFDFEVDYRLGPHYIIEYHGIHHYKTNSKYPIETTRSNWKVNCLKRKGYKVFVVPFYDWNKLEVIYEKKEWLVKNMQKHLFFN